MMRGLDPTEKPPDTLRTVHKVYQQASIDALTKDTHILDLGRVQTNEGDPRLFEVKVLKRSSLAQTFACFEGLSWTSESSDTLEVGDIKVYEYRDLPGLQFLPSLLPQCTQRTLLSRLLHRDLANPNHKTNVHFHHHIPYDYLSSEATCDQNNHSFFEFSSICFSPFPPLNPDVHKPLTLFQFLQRKLRWMTLGGQYDWTKKRYPEDDQPDFPDDVANLIQGLFPGIRPEAAIVNFYSPGDTLSIHRDVSENCDAGLVSISLGCDGLFLVGLEDPSTGQLKHAIVRLRSGDAVYMIGPSRFAWHSVPQILANTCPSWMSDWPAAASPQERHPDTSNRYEAWRGWMANKRINVNIRQMNE